MNEHFTYERLDWNGARKFLALYNKELVSIIDQISPDKKYGFILMKYPYGAKIFNKGYIQIPNEEGRYTRIDDPNIPKDLQSWLSYSPIPVGLASRPIEVFIEPKDRVAPLGVLPAGSMFGLCETFDKAAANYVTRLWSMSAGSRTIAFLPSITDTYGYKRLTQHFNLKITPPNSIYEEWNIFKMLTNHPDNKCDWACELLFFDNNWFEHQGDSQAWKDLRLYFSEIAWNQMTNWRKKMYFEIIWESLSLEIAKRNLRPTQAQLSLVRYIIDVGNGIWPGLRIATSDEFAPISLLQRIFSDIYQLKNYAPLIVQAQVCQSTDKNPIYISMTAPTHLDHAPKERNAPSTLSEMRQIILINETLQRKLEHEDRPIFNAIKALNYNYFHGDVNEGDPVIKRTAVLLTYDPLLKQELERYPSTKMPEKSPFLRGCILISSNQQEHQ